MMAKNSLKTIISTQSFCPVADVKDGILCMKDGRFVRILEFTPINFMLRSNDERDAIISSFASLLRIMNTKFQIKVVTRKAEIEKFVSIIENDMADEEVQNCRILQQEQIDLIQRIGSERGVTRRFFIIYEFEDKNKLLTNPTFADIAANMRVTQSRICNMLRICGNELVQGENEDLDEQQLSHFFHIYAKGQSEKMSFDDKLTATVMEYVEEHGYSPDEEIIIPTANLLSPDSINTKLSSKSMSVDDIFYSFCYIPGDSYPLHTVGGWLSLLINAGEGIDVDLFVQKEPIATVQRKLQYAIRYNKVKLRDTEDSAADYDDLSEAIESGYYLKQGLSNGDDFCNFGVLITISAHSKQELEWKLGEMKAFLISNDLRIRPCFFRQEEAFMSSLPICKWDKDLFKAMRRNILTSSLASAYPFVSFEVNDENGIYLGVNKTNNSLIFLDNFDSKHYKNANIAIMGTSGSGKTYTLQCMALRMRARKIQTFIIAPDKGHEFRRACEAIGGQYIKLAAGSKQNINIMEIRKTDRQNTELIDGTSSLTDVLLYKKIQQLHVFFSLLIPDMSHEETQILDDALIHTFAAYGITQNNKSLLDPADPTRYKKMPTLEDLQKTLFDKGAPARHLAGSLTRYVSGSVKSFNCRTNVDLNNKYIVLDVSELTEDQLPIGMFIALEYVWDKCREDRTQRKAVFLDELWTLIGAKSSVQAAKFVMEIFKVIRGYGGAAIAATQDLNDFFSLEDGKYGKAIIANAKTKLVMNLEKDEATRVAETLGLTDTEVQQITRFERGEALLAANTNHVTLEIKASATENALITTDRKQLAEIAKAKRDALASQS